MQTTSKLDSAGTDKEPKDNRRLGTPNHPVAVTTFVFNTFKEALLHPTVTSTLDMRTGKVIARDRKKMPS